MPSIYRIIFAAIFVFCIFNSAFCRPSISSEREILKAEIKHETHKLRMLRELLNELEEDKPLPIRSRARRHRTLSHKDDCYFHPVTC
uniref:Uncharacterized protein n=1 Tax=Panagrolaimus davidi TaxID=227884 RepID=A0A914QSQ6_9BILA